MDRSSRRPAGRWRFSRNFGLDLDSSSRGHRDQESRGCFCPRQQPPQSLFGDAVTVAASRRAVLPPRRSAGPDRGLANRLRRAQAARRAGDAHLRPRSPPRTPDGSPWPRKRRLGKRAITATEPPALRRPPSPDPSADLNDRIRLWRSRPDAPTTQRQPYPLPTPRRCSFVRRAAVAAVSRFGGGASALGEGLSVRGGARSGLMLEAGAKRRGAAEAG